VVWPNTDFGPYHTLNSFGLHRSRTFTNIIQFDTDAGVLVCVTALPYSFTDNVSVNAQKITAAYPYWMRTYITRLYDKQRNWP